MLCLIVDDSSVVRKVVRRILEEMDIDCAEAADGQQAFESCQNTMPDVIMLDWNMPVMNGMEFMRKLRAHPTPTQPKIIFCTTENDTDHIQAALAAGADEYIMKPFDSDIIRSKFEQIGLL